MLKLEVWDYDWPDSDDIIGSFTFDLAEQTKLCQSYYGVTPRVLRPCGTAPWPRAAAMEPCRRRGVLLQPGRNIFADVLQNVVANLQN